MKSQPELFIQMALDAWNIHIDRASKLLAQLSDDQLQKPIAPGKNRGVYLLAHLIAIHDKMLPLLNLDGQKYPELYNHFVEEPDSPEKPSPSLEVLRESWQNSCTALAGHFAKLTVEEWFQRHQAVSEEDFKKEPNRNRLNLVMNRTNHLAGHYGQLLLLKK